MTSLNNYSFIHFSLPEVKNQEAKLLPPFLVHTPTTPKHYTSSFVLPHPQFYQALNYSNSTQKQQQ
jgi:hypothetical protein